MTQGAAGGRSTSTLIKIMAAVRDPYSLPLALPYISLDVLVFPTCSKRAELVRMPRPGIAHGSSKGNSRVTALLVSYSIPMPPTLSIRCPSSRSHPDTNETSHKHQYYKSRTVGRANAISRRQYPASQVHRTCTAGSPLAHQCCHPT